MRVERVRGRNWMPFGGRFDLELPSGSIAVVCRYVENPRRSNWGGKTAFLEALRWAITGEHRKRYDDDVIHRGTDDVLVELVLTGAIEIARSKTRGKPYSLTLTIPREGGDPEVLKQAAAQERINSLLGLTGADWNATQFFAQGDIEAIVERKSGERRSIISTWLELDVWGRIAARARAHARDLGTKHADLAVRIRTWEADPVLTENPMSLDADRTATMVEIAKLEKGETDLRARLDEIAEIEVLLGDRDRFEKVSAEGRALRATLESTKAPPRDELDGARNEADDLRVAETKAREEVDAARELAEGRFDGRCPVTCTDCPVADEVRDNVDAAKARLKSARAKLGPIVEDATVAKRKLAGLEGLERDLARKRERYNSLVEEGRRLKARIAKLDGIKVPSDAEVATTKGDLVDVRDALRAERTKLADIDAKRSRRESLARDVERSKRELAEIERKMRTAALVTKAVGPTGVPARIAEAELAALERRANALLADTGLAFSFAWDRETRDVAPQCYECGYVFKGTKDKACPACAALRGMKRADELEILVDDGSGEIEDAKAKSGAAKVLVASAIRLAAGLMLRELRGTRAAFAMVDEPFGPLDGENRTTLARTFAAMLGAVGLEQVFVVSHDTVLLDALPASILIKRDGEKSTVARDR